MVFFAERGDKTGAGKKMDPEWIRCFRRVKKSVCLLDAMFGGTNLSELFVNLGQTLIKITKTEYKY